MDGHEPSPRRTLPAGAARRLLAWYERERRDLPWRRDRSPYRVWVSEVMLQQTRVETALPYYDRFMEHFPDVDTLASSEVDDVLALWSGLGYYRRARWLHATARRVVEQGGFPRTAEELLALPGIGPYTSAAIASIAFGERVPVVDGNVERVASRLTASSVDPKSAIGRRRIRAVASSLLDRQRPGDSNQALMELGATVCTPRSPLCRLCPLEADCAAARSGEPTAYPAPRTRRKPMEVSWLAARVERGGRLLLFRRAPEEELLAGTWELPWIEADAPDPAGGLAERYGGSWKLEGALGSVEHSITHRRLRVEVRRARLEPSPAVAEGPEARWVAPREVASLPTSSLVEKILALQPELQATATARDEIR